MYISLQSHQFLRVMSAIHNVSLINAADRMTEASTGVSVLRLSAVLGTGISKGLVKVLFKFILNFIIPCILVYFYSYLGCPIAGIDLVFVLDASGSIGPSNFQLIREFVANISTILDIGPDNSQVGVIVFRSSASVQFHLNTYSDMDDLLSAIAALPYTGGGTNTAAALNLVLTQGFLGARPTSQGVPRVVMVVTDGLSNDRNATAAAAQALHATGLTVFAAGIGGADMEELNAIASSPEFVQFIDSFDTEELQRLQEALSEEACRG